MAAAAVVLISTQHVLGSEKANMMRSLILLASAITLTLLTACSNEVQTVDQSEKALPDVKDSIVTEQTVGRKCPADRVEIHGYAVVEVLELLGAKGVDGATDDQLASYLAIFARTDVDSDGKHSQQEYVENGRHMTPQARRGIFRAADNNGDGFVTAEEYILNRIITDEAKGIIQQAGGGGFAPITRDQFVAGSSLEDKELAGAVFDALDSNGNGSIITPEYLVVWGSWARPNYKDQEAVITTRLEGRGE